MFKVQAGTMRAGENGRTAVLWSQTEIDGLEAAPLSFLTIGAAWSWRGQARYLIETATQALEWTGQARGGAAATLEHCAQVENLPEEASGLLVLTNGAQTFTAALFPVVGEAVPMLVFEGDCPDRDQEFWISEIAEGGIQSDTFSGIESTVVAFPARSERDLDEADLRVAVRAGRRAD
jgi:hypothetical protein